MGDRVPIVTVPGDLSQWLNTDLPIGSVGQPQGQVTRVFVWLLEPSGSGNVVAEIRDSSQAVATVTVSAGQRSAELAVSAPTLLAGGTNLFLRITSAGTGALSLGGWYELSPVGTGLPALTNLDRVKRFLGISGTSDDTLLTELINSVSAQIQAWLRRGIVQGTATEKLDGAGQYHLVLGHYPVVSVTSVVLDGQTLTSSDYEVELLRGELLYTPGGDGLEKWPVGRRIVEVTYSYGYSSVPEDLIHAATLQVAYQYKRSAAAGGRLGERQTVVGGEVAQYLVDAWFPDAIEILRRHRRGAAWA